MEGLAITPNGRTPVGIMQNSLIQDSTPLDGSSQQRTTGHYPAPGHYPRHGPLDLPSPNV